MSQTFGYDGREYNYQLSTDDIKDTPSWNPLNGDPSLSMQSALTIARTNLKRFVKIPGNWQVKSIKLQEVDAQNWIYDITFQIKSELVRSADFSFNIPVKMDRKIVEPKINTKDNRNVR